MWRRTLIRGLLLLLAGGALGWTVNAARGQAGLPLARPIETAPASNACSAAPTPEPRFISLEEAARLRGATQVTFGDTRPAEAFARGHIAGAWHLPCFRRDQADPSLARLTPSGTLVLYGEQEESAIAGAADELTQRGFSDVRLLRGGWRAWQSAGLPAESGPCLECREP